MAFYSLKRDFASVERTAFHGYRELGGVYMKFLQIIALKPGFFSSFTSEDKMAVYDAVHPEDINIKSMLTQELGEGWDSQMIHVDDHPFAAGSFGQVYYAQHADGTNLIIKALRPNLVQFIRMDLKLLRVMAYFVGQKRRGATDIGRLFKDFRDVVLAEIDYRSEADHALYFYNYFYYHPNIVIPKTYSELSSDHLIVQEYIDGLPMTQIVQEIERGESGQEFVYKHLGSDLEKQMRILGEEILRSVLTAERILGDPHPGNIKVMTHDRVGIYDFGITGFPPDDRKAFLAVVKDYLNIHKGIFDPGLVFVNSLRFFVGDLYRAINTISMAAKARLDVDIMEEIRKTAQRAYDQNKQKVDVDQFVKTGHISKIMNYTVNEGNKFRLRVEFDSSVMIRSADGYTGMLDKLKLREKLIPSTFDDAIARLESEGLMLMGKNETMDFDNAVNIVSDWVQDLMESDPIMFRNLAYKFRRSTAVNE